MQSFNGTAWVTDDPIYGNSSRPAPEELKQFFTNPVEVISPALRTRINLLEKDEMQLTLPDGSQSSTYHPTDEEWPDCA